MLFFILLFSAASLLAAEGGKIVRPSDRAVIESGPVDVAARAPGGRIELDGKAVEAEQPFPDVFHARIEAARGEHTLSLVWQGGRKDIRIWVGDGAPEGFAAFQQHPPVEGVQCEQCHGLSRRGRFRFKGGCLDCHAKAAFEKTHAHELHVFEDCGLCHNAHGSTAKAHLIHPRETACTLCHGLSGAKYQGRN